MKKVLIIAVVMMGFAICARCEENKAVNKSPFAFIQGFVMGTFGVSFIMRMENAPMAR